MSASSRFRVLMLVLAGVLVAVYGARAVSGVVGGLAYLRAVPRIDEGEYEQARKLLRWADVGPDRGEVLLLSGEVKRGLWRIAVAAGAAQDAMPLLAGAAADFLEAAWSMPATAWPWASLGDVYDRLERERRGLLSDVRIGENGSWNDVGREGVIAIGLLRKAVERSPGDPALWDQLAMVLLRYGLHDEALAAVRASARAHPVYTNHPFPYLKPQSADLLSAFAEGARGALGHAPMIDRGRHLVALARLAMRMGEPAEAERTLLAALEQPGKGINRAETRYWLGRALAEQGRYDEAEENLVAAGEQPVFEVLALEVRADIAERRGRPEQALELWRQVRWAAPERLEPCLHFAELARRLGRWDEALEALAWAGLMHEDDARPLAEQARTLLEKGEPAAAWTVIGRYVEEFGESAESRALKAAIERANTERKSP